MSFSTCLSGGCVRDSLYIVKMYWLDINSFHHQAAAVLGLGLRAVRGSARRHDRGARGSRPRAVLLGVQWHAEAMVDRPRAPLAVRGLVDAAARPRLALVA